MTKNLLHAAQRLFCFLHYSGRTDRLLVKASNWWSTAAHQTSYRRLACRQALVFGFRVGFQTSEEGVVLKWEPHCKALISEFASFSTNAPQRSILIGQE